MQRITWISATSNHLGPPGKNFKKDLCKQPLSALYPCSLGFKYHFYACGPTVCFHFQWPAPAHKLLDSLCMWIAGSAKECFFWEQKKLYLSTKWLELLKWNLLVLAASEPDRNRKRLSGVCECLWGGVLVLLYLTYISVSFIQMVYDGFPPCPHRVMVMPQKCKLLKFIPHWPESSYIATSN